MHEDDRSIRSADSTAGRSGGWRRGARRGRAGRRRPPSRRPRNEALHDYVPDAQDTPRLLRRISGLHTERWQDHFGSISQGRDPGQGQRPGAALLGLGRLLPHLSDLGAADRGDDPPRPHHDHAQAPRPGLAADRDHAARATPTCRPTCRPGRTTRSASERSTSAGPPTASTAPTTSARSAGSRPRAASGFSTSTSSRCTTARRSERRCC